MAQVLRPVRDWIVQNNRRRFWLSEVVKGTGLDRRKVLRVLEGLRKKGFLEIVEEKKVPISQAGEFGPPRREPKFELTRDLSKAAFGRKKAVTCRDKVWRTFRIIRITTKSELVRLTGCPLSSVEEYLKLLMAHGYVRSCGKKGREKLFALVKNPGPGRPETPEIRRK